MLQKCVPSSRPSRSASTTPTAKGLAQRRRPGHPRRRARGRATGCRRSARVADRAGALADDGERGVGAARPRRARSAPTAGAGTTVADRPRAGSAALPARPRPHQSPFAPRPVDRRPRPARCCPTSSRALAALTDAGDRRAATSTTRSLPELARPCCAPTGRMPPTSSPSSTAPWTRWTWSPGRCCGSATASSSSTPASRRCSTCSRPAASTSSGSRSTRPASTSTRCRGAAAEPARSGLPPAARRRTRPGCRCRPTRARRLAARAARARLHRRRGRLGGRRRDVRRDQPRARGSRTRCCTSAASASRTAPTCGSRRSAAPAALLAPRAPRRAQLGQGWTSRLLQRVLLGLLRDDDVRPTHRPRPARSTPDGVSSSWTRSRRTASRSAGTDGLNIWVPGARRDRGGASGWRARASG